MTNAPGAPTTEFKGLAAIDADLVFGAEAAYADLSSLPQGHPLAAAVPRREAGLLLDSSWTCGGGPRTNDSVYDGETFDARRKTPGWSKSGWTPPSELEWGSAIAALPFAKDIKVQAQSQPPIKDMLVYSAVNMTKATSMNYTYRFDFGQNTAGAVQIALPDGLPSGFTLTIVHAEAIMHPPYGDLDGTVYVGNLRSAKQTDTYIHDGSSNATHNFGEATQHGFRYALVTASGPGASTWTPDPSFIQAVHFRTGINIRGKVSVQDAAQLIDKVHHACQMVEANNAMGVVSDCPQRDERKGWMGDSALSTESFFLNFNAWSLFPGWVANMRASQINPYSPSHGNAVGDTVPISFGGAVGDPSWQTAYPTAIKTIFENTGDMRLPTAYSQPIAGYIHDLAAAANSTGIGKMFAHYGEWVTPPAYPTSVNSPTQGPKPPTALISAYNFIGDLDTAAMLSTAIGDSASAASYRSLAAYYRLGFQSAFWDDSIQAYGAGGGNRDGLQTSTAIALARGGIAPSGSYEEKAFGSLVNDIVNTHNESVSVGITGNKVLWRVLTDMGRSDLAVTLLQQFEYPSFGFMIQGGPNGYEPATTMWELWSAPLSGPGMNSRAHHMFSSVDMTFYNYVAGVQQAPGSLGFAKTQYRPRITRDARIAGATATIPTLRGDATITWANGTAQAALVAAGTPAHPDVPQVSAGQFSLTATLPVGGGTLGAVHIACPAAGCDGVSISCNGHSVWAAGKFVPGVSGVTSAAIDGSEVVFQVGPGGEFAFESQA